MQPLHAKSASWHLLLIFYAALIAAVFGMMVASFPLGAYVVFSTDIGESLNHEFPLDSIFFFAVLPFVVPLNLQLGEVFIAIWCVYLLFFSILIFGRRKNLLDSLVSMVRGAGELRENSLGMVIAWLAVLYVISKGLDLLLTSAGVSAGAIEVENHLVQFLNLTAAPLREEAGFRVLLIGIPAYMIFAERRSFASFFRTLWHPSGHLPYSWDGRRNIYVLIAISATIFGLAHLFFGGGWTYGKVPQAIVGGLILGWVYYRYGFHAAVILHWSVNYFVFSYAYFGSTVWGFSWSNPAQNPMLAGIDTLLTMVGVIAIGIFLRSFLSLSVRGEQNSFKGTGLI